MGQKKAPGLATAERARPRATSSASRRMPASGSLNCGCCAGPGGLLREVRGVAREPLHGGAGHAPLRLHAGHLPPRLPHLGAHRLQALAEGAVLGLLHRALLGERLNARLGGLQTLLRRGEVAPQAVGVRVGIAVGRPSPRSQKISKRSAKRASVTGALEAGAGIEDGSARQQVGLKAPDSAPDVSLHSPSDGCLDRHNRT